MHAIRMTVLMMFAAFMSADLHAASPAAKQIFGHQDKPAPVEARAIGSYARGCLAGGKALPINGPAWQAMRVSRNRNWGHPALIDYLERLAVDAQKLDDWPGLLVGDLAQPMGGPMLTGHASHQIGLDADIWLTPMPDQRLSRKERETRSAISMLAEDRVSTDPSRWTQGHARLIRRAASYDEVARIFVHPAIKKTLCAWAGDDRDWLSKVRPWWGHHYHFHVRLACPPGSSGCVNQNPVGSEDGCGREVDSWLAKMRRPVVKPKKPVKKSKPKPGMPLDALPSACVNLVGEFSNVSLVPLPTRPIPLPVRKPKEITEEASLTGLIRRVIPNPN